MRPILCIVELRLVGTLTSRCGNGTKKREAFEASSSREDQRETKTITFDKPKGKRRRIREDRVKVTKEKQRGDESSKRMRDKLETTIHLPLPICLVDPMKSCGTVRDRGLRSASSGSRKLALFERSVCKNVKVSTSEGHVLDEEPVVFVFTLQAFIIASVKSIIVY